MGDLVVDTGTAGPVALDLVAILDDSCSMDEELQTLATKTLPAALDNLAERSELDWRIILRLAAETAGNLGEVSRDAESTADDISALVSQVPSADDQSEAGLGAAALSMVHDGLREQANLVFWVVSDEPDQSVYATPRSYLAQASQFHVPPYSTSMTATIYRETADWWCAGAGEVGDGYLEVADRLLSLCEPETWGQAVTDAADAAEQLNLTWTLSRVPVNPFDIRVYLNDEPEDGWTWDGLHNRVVLDDAPPEGTDVLIAYVAVAEEGQ